jgi:hypothetical protein
LSIEPSFRAGDAEADAPSSGNLLASPCNIFHYHFPDFNLEHAQLPDKPPTMYLKFPTSRALAFTGSVDCGINWQLYVHVKRGTQVESGLHKNNESLIVGAKFYLWIMSDDQNFSGTLLIRRFETSTNRTEGLFGSASIE